MGHEDRVFLGEPYRIPKSAMITIPYSDYQFLIAERRRLQRIVSRPEAVVIDESEIEPPEEMTPEQEEEMKKKFLYSMSRDDETGEIKICPMNDEKCITIHGETEAEFFINHLRDLVQKA